MDIFIRHIIDMRGKKLLRFLVPMNNQGKRCCCYGRLLRKETLTLSLVTTTSIYTTLVKGEEVTLMILLRSRINTGSEYLTVRADAPYKMEGIHCQGKGKHKGLSMD
jgi:hypothetical protein